MEDVGENRSISDCVVDLRKSSRSDLVASLSALITFPLGFWVCGRIPRDISPDFIANLSLLTLSAVLASISVARANWDLIPLDLQPSSATRWGARIGSLVFLFAGGAYLLGGMAAQVKPAMTGIDGLGASPLSTGVTGITFSMLPTIATGSITCLFRLKSRTLDHPSAKSDRIRTPSTKGERTMVAIACLFFALGLLSSGIPVLLDHRRIEATNKRIEHSRQILEEENRRRADLADADSAALSQDTRTPIDLFHYEPPEDFANAPAARLKIIETRPIPDLSSGTVVLFSPDSRFLAFVDQSNNMPLVIDLRNDKLVCKFPPMPKAAGMSWSPKGGRLFYLGIDRSCWVIDPSNRATICLPTQVPVDDLTPHWKSENEIQFYFRNVFVANLDLVTLRSSFSREAMSSSSRDSDATSIDSLGETNRCKLLIRSRISTLSDPLRSTSGKWSFGGSVGIFCIDKESGRAYSLFELPNNQQNTLLVSPDASIIILATTNGALAHYIGISDGIDINLVTAERPPLPDVEKFPQLTSLIESGCIGAFICAPLVNPLNGNIVGADAHKVRALALLNAVDSDHCALAVVESYSPIQPGDVVGFMHIWNDREPLQISSQGIDTWWNAISVTTEKTNFLVDPPKRWQDPNLESTRWGIEFRGWRDSAPKGPEFKTVSLSSTKRRTEAIVSNELIKPNGDNIARRIENFVKAHHANVGRYDLKGFVNDYAPSVDFCDKGHVTVDFIRRDQAAYLPLYEKISETVSGDVAVWQHGAGWRAVYNLRSYAIRKDNKNEYNRRIVITLDLVQSESGSFQITRERATVKK